MKFNSVAIVATLIAASSLFAIGTANAQVGQDRAARDANERIVGGETVKFGKGPWSVRLNVTKSNGTFICGASLVAPDVAADGRVTWHGNKGDARWLITAAHCLYDRGANAYVKPDAVEAITGRLDLKISDSNNPGFGEPRDIIAILPHADYVKNRDDDVALMIMGEAKKDLNLNLRKSIRLPTLSDAGWIDNPYLALISQGWGKIAEAGATSQELLEVRVPLVDRETCERQYAIFGSTIPAGQICAGFRSGGFDSCGGDSGGPLLYRPATDSNAAIDAGNLSHNEVLVGVVSWGVGCARQDLFGVYTSTARYKSWLDEKVVQCYNKPSLNDCN